ncbi:MAG TPA: PIG-L family deacetylase [Opitutaceae bacterium]|nr:PIG-L family deacetylase [Opitutaceae bacterium]
MKRILFVVATLLAALRIQAADTEAGSPIALELQHFRQMGSVLYIAAHPDDENTQLITYLARGRGYRTAYLSITRGDGGQNVLGPEFGAKLGVARTQELLAARRLDGGRQFFTRAIDFGFSKDYQETLKVWDRDQVLSDVVRVIRTFRPDVIVTRFSTTPGGTHGHHTASAVLALEAFKLAGDPKAYPEQLRELKPWQPKRILWNAWGGLGNNAPPGDFKIDVSGKDPVLGVSFLDLASQSRSQHKTQGFGAYSGQSSGPRWESFKLLAGEPAQNDLMDGVDLTWSRVAGGAEIGKRIDAIVAKFNPSAAEGIIPDLLSLRSRLAGVPTDPVVEDKRKQLDQLIQHCLGLTVETAVTPGEATPGEKITLTHTVRLTGALPIKWKAVSYPLIKHGLRVGAMLAQGAELVRETAQVLPGNIPLTQPYWLRQDAAVGMFRVADQSLIGVPENPPAFPVEYIFEVNGQFLTLADEPRQSDAKADQPELRSKLAIIAPVSLQFASSVKLFAPGETKDAEVEILAARPVADGILRLEVPASWKVAPGESKFRLTAGEKTRIRFAITAPADAGVGQIGAVASISGKKYDTDRFEVHYAHIPTQLLQSPARLKAVSLNLQKRGQRIGYIMGAGDDVLDCLRQIGYDVTLLDGAELTPERLRGFDAIVVGVRALNTRSDLSENWKNLFGYAEQGGTVVVQYNNPNNLKIDKIAPFDLKISSERVTDENAKMTILAPQNPVLNAPNKISAADFEGWVQERGLYFPNQWGKEFTPIFASNDTGEPPREGGLLVARCGKGYFAYTGLAFFRQLPAGVPGAYRLFANIVSLGKE